MTDLEVFKRKLANGASLVHLSGSDEWVLLQDHQYTHIGISNAERQSIMSELIAVSIDTSRTVYGYRY